MDLPVAPALECDQF